MKLNILLLIILIIPSSIAYAESRIKYSISGPDGKSYTIEGPKSANTQQIIKAVLERAPSLKKDIEEFGGCFLVNSFDEPPDKICLISEKEKQKRQVIYDNCIISKSKGQLKGTLTFIMRSCTAVSENPSFFEKLRWSR